MEEYIPFHYIQWNETTLLNMA